MVVQTISQAEKMNTTKQESSWHNQFWPWFIIGVLVTTISAGIATIIIAVKHDDSLVVDNYYKKGLAINQVLTQKQNALDLGVIASLNFNTNNKKLIMVLPASHAMENNVIKIRLVHATISEFDREHFLTRNQDNQYAVTLEGMQSGWWRIIIEPVDAQWQLEQRVQFPIQNMVTIKPTL